MRSEPILMSKSKAIRILKEKNLLPDWYQDHYPILPDPDKRIFFISVELNNSLSFSLKIPKLINGDKKMNYIEMATAIEKGNFARRASWKEGEKLWSDGKIMIHNTPYFNKESEYNPSINGYVYVCEKEDVFANDWELCAS